MKKIALALLASSAFAGSAFAADMSVPVYTKAPAAVPVFSWTGFYIGVNGGVGWGNTTEDLTSLSVGAAAVPLTLPLSNLGTSGFMGGAQAGFNYQIGPAVFGVEADGDWADITGHGPCLAVLTCSSKTKWLFDVSGRVGLAVDRALVYVKGGYAWAGIDYNATAGAALAAPNSLTRSGGEFGLGIEYAITNNWTAKVEYDYIDFRSTSSTIPVAVAGAGAAIAAGVNQANTLQMMKAGVNYKF